MPRVNAPAPPITGQVVRMTFLFQTQGNVQEVLQDYMGNVVGPHFQDAADLAAAFKATFDPIVPAVITTSTVLLSYVAQTLSDNITPTFELPSAAVGTVVGDYLPLEMQATIEKSSRLKGQHGRGRLQMPAVPVSFTTHTANPNTLGGVGQTAYNGFANNLLGPFPTGAGTSFAPVISTRPTPPANLVTLAQLVVAWNVNQLLGTQRRRRPGRGI